MNETSETREHQCVIYIQASRERVWEGLTTPGFTQRYFHETRVESDWQLGSDVIYYNPDRTVAVAGKVLEMEYPRRLSFTWQVHYDRQARQESPSRVTFTLDQVAGEATCLTVLHDQFPADSVVLPQISRGWIAILSNLKTLLETGNTMTVS
ncbi:MAG: SRPBCC family protein [Proteobacteria bacterium]|jgi:uncharacterized protein YndB with AHSA1/START domain|nr:SRPBCC family protein [Pseudomonadota bacterium]MDA1299922.1 SRPBCC family protein [Pseudomonadota bacterium]